MRLVLGSFPHLCADDCCAVCAWENRRIWRAMLASEQAVACQTGIAKVLSEKRGESLLTCGGKGVDCEGGAPSGLTTEWHP